VHLCAQKMKRLVVIFMVLSLFSVLAFAEDTRFVREELPNKQLVGPDGIYMMLSHYNRNVSLKSMIGYEQELAVYTSEFKDRIRVFSGAFVTVFVVKNDIIEEITSKVPAIPEDGYLVVGHGRASVAFMVQFEVGDKVEIRDYTPQIADGKYMTLIYMPDGTDVEINGWNRGRGPDEVVVFNADYGDKTYSNEWGYEFAVDVDEVYELRTMGQKESLEIPKKGFVVSGHGNKVEMVNRVMEGDLVELDK